MLLNNFGCHGMFLYVLLDGSWALLNAKTCRMFTSISLQGEVRIMDLQVYGGKERSEGNYEKYNEVKKLIHSLVSYFIFFSSCCFL